MIDTLYIYTLLKKDTYNTLFQAVNILSKEKNVNLRPEKVTNPQIKRYCTHAFNNIGFLELVFSKVKNTYPKYIFEIKLHPKKLMDSTNIYDVTYYHELNAVREKFNLFIQHISAKLPDFWDWHCRRIDYAITLKNRNTATYINLFKAGSLSKTFYKKADNYSNLEGSLYVPSNSDEIRLNFYDKHAQLRELKGIINEITKTSDNLRIEVQCNREKLDHIRKKFDIKNNTVKNMLNLKICQYIITYHYNMVCDIQSYFSFSIASKRLHTHQSKLNYSANELIKTLEIIRLRGSIWKSKINFSAGLNAFDKRIREIKNIGINPVTLPDDLQITYLPNLYMDVKKNFETIELGILD